MTRIAVIGLGAMGSRVAHRLLDAGDDVTVWNRTAAKAEPFGERAAATAADAVRDADLVITMLANPEALADVTPALATAAPGATIVEMSTVGPEAVARLRDALPDEVELADAPVLGSRAEAESGKLVVFVGATDATFGRLAAALAPLGTLLHVGPLGAGAAAKLVANSTLFGVIGVLGEALALADGLGLEREVAWRVLEATPVGTQVERRRPAIESGDYPPRFPVALALKDAELVADAAERAGVDVRIGRAARDWLRDTARDDDEADYAAMLRTILAG